MASSPRRRHARDDFAETIRIVEDVEIFLHTGQGYRKTKLKMAEQTLRASDERWVFTNKAIPLRNEFQNMRLIPTVLMDLKKLWISTGKCIVRAETVNSECEHNISVGSNASLNTLAFGNK